MKNLEMILRLPMLFKNLCLRQLLYLYTQQKNDAAFSIREYIHRTDADKVIVFSKRIWEHLFNKPKNWGNFAGKIETHQHTATIWHLEKNNGQKCIATGFNHPSTRGWKKEEWRPILNDFLKL